MRLTTERVDDIPLLMEQMERMGLPTLLDEHFKTHGNWSGLSLGWTSVVWLTHILSQADHRLNQVEGWAEKRLQTLQQVTQQSVRALDVSDDRLSDVLRALSDDTQWQAFEGHTTTHLLRVYNLQATRVRLDATTASGYWEVTDDGLFQFGLSKDHRPDLPQVKVMLGVLDPLGLPVATEVAGGARADDPLYRPIIQRIRDSLRQPGLLYVGDCKMGALDTRADIATHDDFYLCPLSAVTVPATLIQARLATLRASGQALTVVKRTVAGDPSEPVATGYEWTETQRAEVEGQTRTWSERRLLIRSVGQARSAEKGLRARLAHAQAALTHLTEQRRGKARLMDLPTAQQAVERILARYQVADWVAVSFTEQVQERQVRAYRDRPARMTQERTISMTCDVDTTAVETAVNDLGWRVYATNQLAQHLSLEQAVWAYREQYYAEQGFGRLKGQPLSLSPMYLARDDHASGLIRLLSIALRVLTLLQFVVRRRLTQEQATLTGLYAGQPKRATTRPTAERLLDAFQDITLTVLDLPQGLLRHLTPLSPLQLRILALLDFAPDVYSRLAHDSSLPP